MRLQSRNLNSVAERDNWRGRELLEYNVFKELVQKKIMDYMPEEYQHLKPEVSAVTKVNTTLDGLALRPERISGRVASPCVYINNLYETYRETGKSLDAILTQTAKVLVDSLNDSQKIVGQMEDALKNYKEKVTFKLINYEQNKECLADRPHRRYLDLAVVYGVAVLAGEDCSGSAVVSNSLMESLGTTEEELFQLAKENTRNLNSPRVSTMFDMLSGLARKCEFEIPPELPDDSEMYVITNEKSINGATSIFYEDLLHDLAEKLQDDLYILPSSIHEVIVIPSNGHDLEELTDMVHEINSTQVDLTEQLSNQVYRYDRAARELTQATDTQYKRLDGLDENNITPKKRGR